MKHKVWGANFKGLFLAPKLLFTYVEGWEEGNVVLSPNCGEVELCVDSLPLFTPVEPVIVYYFDGV